jgi:AraC-like DNA-binding protein
LLILPPGIDHALVEASPDLEFFAIGFHPELVHAYAQASGRNCGFEVACKQLPDAVTERLSDRCGGLGETPDHSAVESVLREPLEHAALDDEQRCDSQLRLGVRAASLLLGDGSIRRSQIAKALASNQGDISRSFRRDNGLTLREYRKRIRVLRFLQVVDSDPKNLARAAHRSGFGSYSQCHRDFSVLLGASPREFLTSGQREAIANRFEPMIAAVRS